jgi:predicted nucleotidyltransferase
MALSEDRIDKIVRGFISRLTSEIAVEEVILFGSYAHGNAKEHSDIDLAIISDWFRDKTRIENMQYLSRVAANYNSLIEALPFTPEEYRNLDNRTFLATIVKTGRRYPLDNPPLPRHRRNSSPK